MIVFMLSSRAEKTNFSVVKEIRTVVASEDKLLERCTKESSSYIRQGSLEKQNQQDSYNCIYLYLIYKILYKISLYMKTELMIASVTLKNNKEESYFLISRRSDLA